MTFGRRHPTGLGGLVDLVLQDEGTGTLHHNPVSRIHAHVEFKVELETDHLRHSVPHGSAIVPRVEVEEICEHLVDDEPVHDALVQGRIVVSKIVTEGLQSPLVSAPLLGQGGVVHHHSDIVHPVRVHGLRRGQFQVQLLKRCP